MGKIKSERSLSVEKSVLLGRDDLQVRQSIVERILVFVVNMFAAFESSAQMLFHDITMLVGVPAIGGLHPPISFDNFAFVRESR